MGRGSWGCLGASSLLALYHALTVVVQRKLSTHAEAAGISVSDDVGVQGLITAVRGRLQCFVTPEWSQHAPDLTRGLEDMLQGLGAQESLGEAFPSLMSGVPLLAAPVAALPVSLSPAASPVDPPPPSRTPSAGPAIIVHSLPATDVERAAPSKRPASDAEHAARPTRPLPRAQYRKQRDPSLEEVLPPLSSTATVVPRTPAPRAAKSMPADSKKTACARCKLKKKACVIDKGALSCALCLRDGEECVLAVSGAPRCVSALRPLLTRFIRFFAFSPPPVVTAAACSNQACHAGRFGLAACATCV